MQCVIKSMTYTHTHINTYIFTHIYIYMATMIYCHYVRVCVCGVGGSTAVSTLRKSSFPAILPCDESLMETFLAPWRGDPSCRDSAWWIHVWDTCWRPGGGPNTRSRPSCSIKAKTHTAAVASQDVRLTEYWLRINTWDETLRLLSGLALPWCCCDQHSDKPSVGWQWLEQNPNGFQLLLSVFLQLSQSHNLSFFTPMTSQVLAQTQCN